MSEIEKAAADVLIGGYVLLILVLAWVSITYRSRHRAYKEGYEHGFEKGERLGYERYGAEIEGVMGNAIGAAYHAARTRDALTPQADWGPQRVSPD